MCLPKLFLSYKADVLNSLEAVVKEHFSNAVAFGEGMLLIVVNDIRDSILNTNNVGPTQSLWT